MVQPAIEQCVDEMRAYVESQDYAGYDPYDALNSPLIRTIGARSKWIRIVATQALRRLPLNMRPLLGIRKGHNPKGIGLFLWGYTRLHAVRGEPELIERIKHLLDVLEELRSPDCQGHGWGYNFDWQSRTAMRPKGTPTVVNTAFVGHALLDCYEGTGIARALELAVPIKDFILGDLNRTHEGDTMCFSYTPVDRETVHNANLLGASILARLTKYCEDSRLATAAEASLDYSMKRQRADGSWLYADTSVQHWIDSFHTGFNLQAIRYILGAGLGGEHRSGYEKGVEFYANRFTLPDGTPKYYHDKVYPIDIHAPAQAICFFAKEGRSYEELTDRILAWVLRHMYSGRGYFYFRKGRVLTNRISYMRWAQAWAFHALTEYLHARSERKSDDHRDDTGEGTDTRGAGDLFQLVPRGC
jgi:hypothetical protein